MSSAALTVRESLAVGQRAAPESTWQTRLSAGTRWWLRDDCPEQLVGPQGLRWADWQRAEGVQIVKTGPHRTVYRVALSGEEFYVKHFRVAHWQARIRNLIRKSPAEREFEAVHRIAAMSLPTFEPVALGCVRGPIGTTDSYLISRAVEAAVPLDHFLLTEFSELTSRRRAVLRQRVATELGGLAARLHSAGVEHIDLHAGNLLIRPTAAASVPLLSLIDLHAVRFHATLSQRRRDRNTAALHQFFAGRSTRADRLRFWKAYHEGLASEGFSSNDRNCDRINGRTGRAAFVKECTRIERLLDGAAEAGWRRADRAWKRGNRHVRRADSRGIRCRGLATLDPRWLQSIRDNPEWLFERHLVRWCKRSGRHQVAEVAMPFSDSSDLQSVGDKTQVKTSRGTGPDTGPIGAFWKRIAGRGLLSRLVTKWRMSPVRRAWEVGHALLRRGIETPRPLIFVETGSAPGAPSYLLTQSIGPGLTATEFFQKEWPLFTAEQRIAWIRGHARRLARSVRRLHDSGFDHRDLKFPNLLVSADPADDRVWLLDLDAVGKWPKLPGIRARQNLSRINVSAMQVAGISRADRLRFLKWYLGSRFADEWKQWWRVISRRSLGKIARNHRLGRPLS
ncbi:MAG: hypothetical protein EXS05_23515 [Planctomycetaceae bacterium]|nr:hypothetical protein [Planctomycetaceae bacterium]